MTDQCIAEFIINNFKKKDRKSHIEAFNCLRQLLFARIRALTKRNPYPDDDANDLFQRFAIFLYEKVDQGKFEYQGEPQFIRFFYTTIKRWAKDYWKDDLQLPPDMEIEDEDVLNLEDLEEEEMKNAAFEKCFEELSEKCKLIYGFRYGDDPLPFDQIALLIEVDLDLDPEGGSARMRNAWQRCKEQLKKCVQSFI